MNLKKAFAITTLFFILLQASYSAGPGNESMKRSGKELFLKALDAMGGAQKIAAIESYYSKIRVTRFLYNPTRQNTFDSDNYIVFPDKYRYKVKTDKYTVIITTDGENGWVFGPPGNTFKQLPDKELDAFLAGLRRDPFYISRALDKYNFKFIGELEFSGKKTFALAVSGAESFICYLDMETYLPVGSSYESMIIGGGGPVKNEEVIKEYKTVAGLLVPVRTVLLSNGHKSTEAVIKESQFNIKLTDGFFKGKLEDN